MLLKGQGLTKVYTDHRGLHGVDFELQEGHLIALAGGNGAGKSTLIRLLIGEEQPDSGDIVWAENMTPSIRYMPDDINFPMMLTAEEIMQLLASMKNQSKEQVEAVLKRVGLWEARKKRVRQFSRGMRQRLNLAQSLLGDEQFIILDEPTNGLDLLWIAELKTILREQKEAGKTILFSTHLLSFAQEIADDVLILHDGKVVMHGSLQQVLAQGKQTHLETMFMKKISSFTND